jgi:hypothetical protein
VPCRRIKAPLFHRFNRGSPHFWFARNLQRHIRDTTIFFYRERYNRRRLDPWSLPDFRVIWIRPENRVRRFVEVLKSHYRRRSLGRRAACEHECHRHCDFSAHAIYGER